MSIRLSKSQMDKFVSCPRCFWLAQNHKFKQPEQISSKVWKGIERVTIAHYEQHRLAKTTPGNLAGFVPAGAIPYQADRIDMKALRYWGKGFRFAVDGVEVSTALDDMLQYDRDSVEGMRKLYAVIDYKSKSKATDEESTRQLYQNQADVFDLACNVNGYPTEGIVYFDYWYPIAAKDRNATLTPENHHITEQVWGSQVVTLKADHARIKKLVLQAAACIESAMPDPPRAGKKGEISCAVCAYVEDRETLFKQLPQPQEA